MRFVRLLLPILAVCSLGMGGRPPAVTVRFFCEANARDGSAFSTPYKLTNPPREAFLQKVPSVHEGQIKEVFPFRAPDGSWGCAFRLDNDGRINLEVVSTDHRGSALVGFVGTKRGNHPVVEMIIDRTVADGVISVPRGLTDLEIVALSKQFKVLGDRSQLPNVKLPSEKRKGGIFRKKEPTAPAAAPVA
ncbi:MAG TPA: hypothetical protein VF593_06555 [Chthoniobacteraceae bacterium]